MSTEPLVSQSAIGRLTAEFAGVVGQETVARLLEDSVRVMGGSRVPAFVPVSAERLARERLQALAKSAGDLETSLPTVLFLCVHNAGRSQMAAGWFKHLAAGRAAVYSGGSEPGSEVNSVAVEAMAEVGIDIATEFPKPWTDEVVHAADVVVTMGCGDACPVYPRKRYVDWELQDPAGQGLGVVREVRDEIERRVRGLLAELGVEARGN